MQPRDERQRIPPIFSAALYVAMIIAISALVYGLFERPANPGLRERSAQT